MRNWTCWMSTKVISAEKIEKQISKSDFGLATRFLYQPDLPVPVSEQLINAFHLSNANIIPGGNYHNLKDLFSHSVSIMPALQYPLNPVTAKCIQVMATESLFREYSSSTIY